ncbi:pentatricopeptide repeat-containing protein At3g22150, chloroplastic [Malania oleifera]|uniref:pentatricopeptide repeat-containing protein At3g22150, chloroplastic n=1 Tax=Malania oleifera TaxID=397392 RepID=UPI0025AE1B13|nr:pentatricopeptide repeat-containing protein At3g22150, chloroplastic [Malania oleifera]
MASSALASSLQLAIASPRNHNDHSSPIISPPPPQRYPSESPLPHHQTSANPKPKNPTLRHRLSQLCKDGRPHDARRLFEAVPRPTTVLWNTIIIGFICNNMPYEAILFYARMKSSSPETQYDFYTYSSALKASADARRLRIGKAVHGHILRCHSTPSRIVCNSLLNMYSSCLSTPDGEMSFGDFDFSRYDVVQKVFDTMRKRNVVAWNTMVSWYVKTGRIVEAVKQFKLMMNLGIKPTVVSFVNVFSAVSRIRDHKNANVLYGMLLKLGSEYVNDMFSVSSAIFMFAELGSLDFARIIFNRCLERNTEVWNTMISAYIQNSCHVEAMDLFLQAMESEQTVLDDVTILSALTAISQLQQLDLGQQLHAYIIKNSIALSVTTLNAIIVMYSRCNSVETSFKVFDKMTERDIVSWNTMVTAFVQNGLDDEGLMLVEEMRKQGFVIDSITMTALLSAASNLRNQEIGKQIHAYLLRHGIQFEGMDSYLIDMCAKSGLIMTAQRLFETKCSHDADPATWNAMISGYTQNGLTEQACNTFRRMFEHNLMPNAVTLASILPVCNPIGCIGLGKQLHGFAIRHFLDQNVFVRTALVDMYSKSGAITYAEGVFAEAYERNSVTYTTMILGYGQHGKGEKALSLFQSLHSLSIRPDAITFVAVLSACSYAGLVDEGLHIFESMQREYKIQPLAEHYCCVADMLGRVGRVSEAYELVKELGEDGFNMVEIWGSLLGACRLHKEFELGKVIASKLLEMETRNRMAGYHVLLSNIHAEEGNWETVDNLRKGMHGKGLRKVPGSSWIEVAGSINYFVSRDRKHQRVNKIYEILEDLAANMKVAGYWTRPYSDTGEISEYDE